MRKKIALLLVMLLFVSNVVLYKNIDVYAEGESGSEIESMISESVEEQISNLDTSELDDMFSVVVGDDELFGDKPFSDRLSMIINGELAIDSSSLFTYITNIFFDDVVSYLPYVCLIVAIAVLYSMVSNSSGGKNKSIGDIVHFVCYGCIVVIVISGLSHLLNITSGCITSIKNQMDVVFPLLLTLLTALGGNVSVGIYQPAMAVLSGMVATIFIGVLLPLFTFKVLFTIISNITTGIKFNKFSDFFGSCFKWLLGGIITIFTAFLSIQGLMAGGVDGISIRTAKYTIKSSVPLIGGFLSDGVSLIMLSCSLIKNAIGVSGLIILFCTIILPVLKIVVFSFLMRLASAILEPIADTRVTSFVGDIAKSISTLVAIILGVAFMYFIVIGLVMCSINVM